MNRGSPSLEIFVINLKRSLDRKESIREYLKNRKISFRLLEAVDGANLSAYENSRLTRNIKKPDRLSRGELGCYLSHMEAYRIIRDEKIDIGIIVEDDYRFQRDFDIISQIANIKEKWSVIYIHGEAHINYRVHNIDQIKLANGNFAARYYHVLYGTIFYAIKREYAEELLTVHKLPQKPIDTVLFDIRFCYRLPYVVEFKTPYSKDKIKEEFDTILGHSHFDPSTEYMKKKIIKFKSLGMILNMYNSLHSSVKKCFLKFILNVPWKDRKIKDLNYSVKNRSLYPLRMMLSTVDFLKWIRNSFFNNR